ncbi:8-oxo-dGTP diphosphatase MutT [Gallaecimonas xiamenensis]|uniref:8-oxo-dGTP diphosphatase n=1 Tax=Gallaecimonas xiamenensis 3-C-1 TaxID=745411 RepID=K2IMN1_9GAMM|nr:8-oxo-dGTP diphosphatase MutT [Gallaecimonas xiamenensis]EKE71441.1 mutator MutT protein [Gallaecimonas xiamenensis 3-C-1]
MKKVVHVAVGVIENGRGEVYVTKRLDHQHQGGKWEFPGGKVEDGESLLHALDRELSEEIGINVVAAEPLVLVEHDYGDKAVKLDVWLVRGFVGQPKGLEGQEGRWVHARDLDSLTFPDANGPIIKAVQALY